MAAFFYNQRLDSYANYHVDEGEWIFSGKLYTDLFFYHRDFQNPLWAEQLGTWGSFNPQVGKYLIGLSVNAFAGLDPFSPPGKTRLAQAAARGQSVALTYQVMLMNKVGFYRNSFGNDEAWNRQNNRQPPPDILAAGRRGVAICGLLAGFLVFLIACRLWGGAIGCVALALFLANPVVFAYSRRAMTDIPCLSFVLLGLWLWLESLRALRGRGLARYGLPPLAALAWGLAVSVKLSALAPWAAVLCFTAAVLALSAFARKKHPASSFCPLLPTLYLLLLLCVIPLLVFIASNPFLYDHPFAPYQNFPTRFHFMAYLGHLISGFQSGQATTTLGAKLARGAGFLFHDASLCARLIRFGADVLLFPVALLFLIRGLKGGPDRQEDRIASERELITRSSGAPRLLQIAFLFVSLLTWLATVLWLPFSWDRLLLPLVPGYVMVLSYGLARAAKGIGSWFKSWSASA